MFIVPFEWCKNDVINGCTIGLRSACGFTEKRFKLLCVVSINAWREHILFNELPERYPSLTDSVRFDLCFLTTFPDRFLEYQVCLNFQQPVGVN